MFGVNGGGGVNLQHIVVFSSIFKETVHWVEHLVGQLEEPLPGGATVVQSLFTTEYNVETPAEILRLEPHYLRM